MCKRCCKQHWAAFEKDLQFKFVQRGRSACLKPLPPHVRKITKQCQGIIRLVKHCMTIIPVDIAELTKKYPR